MAKIQGSIRPHDGGCERAKGSNCKCHCSGAGHRSDFVKRALTHSSKDKTFYTDLEDAFGSPFVGLLSAPSPSEKVSRGRNWDPLNVSKQVPRTGKEASQIEQRIVDVSLRDTFEMTWNLNLQKTNNHQNWIFAHNHLLIKPLKYMQQILSTGPTARSGYAWAAILSGTAAFLSNKRNQILLLNPKSLNTVLTLYLVSTPRFYIIAYPRCKTIKYIDELCPNNQPQLVPIQKITNHLSNELCQAYNELNQQTDSLLLLVRLIGSASSLDLWKHPAAVHFCLAPLITQLSAYQVNSGLPSLKKPEKDQVLITKYLKSRWNRYW